MSKPALGRNLARLLDGEPVGPVHPTEERQAGGGAKAMSPALAKLMEGEPVPSTESTAPTQPPFVRPAPVWYWFALDIVLLLVAEAVVAFGLGIPGWIKWPLVFACVMVGAACALWAVLEPGFRERNKRDAALSRVIFD